ncbi:MAG: acyl-CoA dehydrogenase family protein, partial [Actinomycetota bacterium]
MSIAITEDHVALEESAAGVLDARDALGAARELLEADDEARPELWAELAQLGWLGLHVAEEHGGSGYGLEELVVVVERLGRALCPGPFVPTVVTSATLASVGATDRLPGLADGTVAAGVALEGDVSLDGDRLSGSAVVLGGGLADLLVVSVGADVALVEAGADGVEADVPGNLDPTRRSARIRFDGALAEVLTGAAGSLLDHARLILGAEAVGIARECTESAAEYAKDREQFGRPIATFQGVKHHCANMLVATELATSLVWDAARAEPEELPLAAAMAAAV